MSKENAPSNNWLQSLIEYLPRGTRGVVVTAIVATILTACISSGQIQFPVEANTTLAASIPETALAALTQQASVKENVTSTPNATASPSPMPRPITITGIYEKNPLIFAELNLAVQAIAPGQIEVVQGLTCQGLIANVLLTEERIRATGKPTESNVYLIDGDLADGVQCAEGIIAAEPDDLVIVYRDLMEWAQADGYTDEFGIDHVFRGTKNKTIPKLIKLFLDL